MGEPNAEELLAITKFRGRVEDVVTEEELKDPMFLIRWIRARDMDLKKAEEMLRNAIQWRKNNKVDLVLERKMDSFFEENYPRWTDGVDKEGRPVYSAAIGEWDVRKVVKENRTPEFLDYTTLGFEQLLAAIKRGKGQGQNRVTQVIVIFDFMGFPWGQLLNFRAVQNLLQLGSMYEAYYPEILHSGYFINSPSLISTVVALLRPVLAPKTMAKIKIFGSNREEWESEILSHIQPHQIRPRFGGTLGLIQN